MRGRHHYVGAAVAALAASGLQLAVQPLKDESFRARIAASRTAYSGKLFCEGWTSPPKRNQFVSWIDWHRAMSPRKP
ncbi:hypothetical protein [Paenibacillus sp. D51F]